MTPNTQNTPKTQAPAPPSPNLPRSADGPVALLDQRDDTLDSPFPRTIDLTAFDEPTAPEPEPSPGVHPAVTLLAVASILLWVGLSGAWLTLAVVGALAGMIFWHELGHFLAAKATGTKATEFFVGFGPRLWSFRRGETEYGIKAIPLGGYVKILGMHNLDNGVAPQDEARTYRQKSYPRRILMASAGTAMHLILAFVLLVSLFAGFGRMEFERSSRLLEVMPGLPAASAGLQPGDAITSVNGVATPSFDDVVNIIRSGRAQESFNLDVRRGATEFAITVTPVMRSGRPVIGVRSEEAQAVVKRDSLAGGVSRATREIVSLVPGTFVSLAQFFTPSNLRDYAETVSAGGRVEPGSDAAAAAENRMLSPKGATELLAGAARDDIRWFLRIFAAINVFVGMFNMLPLLPLDGGHVLIATYERLRSRPKRGIRYRVDVSRWMPVAYAVMAVLMLLGVSSLYLDIRSPIKVF